MKVRINDTYYPVAWCSKTVLGDLSISFKELALKDAFAIVKDASEIEFHKRDNDSEPELFNVSELISVATGRLGTVATFELR